MRSHNHNETITHLAMPERRIPVLMECPKSIRDGFTVLRDISPSSLNVRRVPENSLELFVDPKQRESFEQSYGAVTERDRQTLLYLLGLADAVTKRDDKALRQAVNRYVMDSEYQDIVWDEVRRSPLYELHSSLNRGIRRTRFVVWWADREKRLAPGLLAQDASGALSALALSSIGQPGGLGVCQRSQCRKPFIRARTAFRQKYCGYKCQTAAGMARLRARKKRKLRTRR